MADRDNSDAGDSAEKAYAAAAQATEPKLADAVPVEFPSKARRVAKPKTPEAAPVLQGLPQPVAAKTTSEAKAPLPAVAKPAVAKAPVAPLAKPAPVASPAKPAVIKAKPAPRKPAVSAPAPVSKPASITDLAQPKTAPINKPADPQLKEQTMATQTTDFTGRDSLGGLKDVFSDVTSKAKAAFEKGTSSIGDVTDFAKGNVEAVVESGKIYVAGLQELGSHYVTEGKTAFETMTADAKELAAQKTPTDFFKLQGEIARKNFDSAIAFGSRSSEAWLKLAGDAFAPLSGRVNLAVDKIKTAA